MSKNYVYENRAYPFVGTDEERQRYVTYFNQQLEQKCLKNNWIFVNVYNAYVDEQGFLDKQLSDGGVHIKNHTFLQQFIDAHLV